MTSGELAERTGVSVDTLRHYEQKGVLPSPPRHGNAYRDYPVDAEERVNTIRRALAVGFTLDELARVFKMRAGGTRPCNTVRKLADEKLQAIAARIEELSALRDTLRATIADWEVRLADTQAEQPAYLLDSLQRS
jgi:DNA-binding transcriptional MerR regulator